MSESRPTDHTKAVKVEQTPAEGPSALTPRVVVLGILFFVYLAWQQGRFDWYSIGAEADSKTYYSWIGLFFLIALYWVVSLIGSTVRNGRPLLSRKELAALFAMIIPAAWLTDEGLIRRSIQSMWDFGLRVHEDPEFYGPWAEYLPSVVAPRAPHIVEALEGIGSVPWSAWLPAILVWSAMYFSLFWIYLCVATMVRHRFTDVERYQYPLVEPVHEMLRGPTEEGQRVGPIWTNRVAQIGMLVGVLYVCAWNVANVIPALPWDAWDWRFTLYGDPWTPTDLVLVASPLTIGLAYLLLNIQILFSIWFFAAIGYAQVHLFDAMGWTEIGGHFSQGMRQPLATGGFLALAVLTLWMARDDLRLMVRLAFGGSASEVEDRDLSNEPMAYGTAFWGFVGGTLFTVAWARAFFQIPVVITVGALLILLVVGIGVARLRIQGGIFTNTVPEALAYGRPVTITTNIIGARNLSPSGYVFSQGFFLFRPNQVSCKFMMLEAMYLGDKFGVRRKEIAWASMIGFATLFLIVGVVYVWLHHQFDVGAMSDWARDDRFGGPIQAVDTVLEQGPFADSGFVWDMIFVGGGALVTSALFSLYTAFAWFPLHPVGYVAGMSAASGVLLNLWTGFAIAWAIKAAVLRYAGTQLDRSARQFFIGGIIGYTIATVLWNIAGQIFGLPGLWYI